MKGYHNNPQATNSMIDADGWLHTGDLGFADKEGYLYVVDRARELVKFRSLHYTDRELLHTMVEEISAHREATDRAAFQTLLLNSVRESVIATDRLHRVTFWNHGAEALFGYGAEEALGQRIDTMIIPPRSDLRSQWLDEARAVLEHGRWQGRAVRQHRNGSSFWSEIAVSTVSDARGELAGFIAIHRDITELQRSEKMLSESHQQLRKLTSSLMLIREEERSSIARELHDELGQQLTRLKIDLASLGVGAQSSLKPLQLHAMADLLDDMIEKVRDISSRLRPAILDDLGLEAAIESHVDDFRRWSGCECRLVLTLDGLQPHRDRDTVVFRIVQEGLTNVARHSSAARVEIHATVTGGKLTVRIEDDGIGIADEMLSNARSLGLLGMRERAEIVNGTLRISRRRPHGTIVQFSVPIETGATHTTDDEGANDRERKLSMTAHRR
jgi:PAS domain S-box-containing protein